MARPKSQNPPAYCLAKDTGRAFVTINGKRVYLGKHDPSPSSESRRKYAIVIGEWEARGRQAAPAESDPDAAGPTLSVVIAAFWAHAEKYYSYCIRPDGKPTGELDNYRLALKPLRRLYGDTPAAKFNAVSLETVRAEMIRLGWCRTNVNRQIARIRRVFRWAAGRDLVPPIAEKLRGLEGLREGHSDARESEPVKPVSEGHAEAVLDYLSPPLQAMVGLQSITGMRPGEMCIMRGVDIDMSGRTWKYRPSKHKNQHRGHERLIDLGPRAQEIVKKFLKTDTQAFLFSPADAAEARRQLRHERRQTPLTCGNVPVDDEQDIDREREPGDHYTPTSYRRAIARACAQAFPATEGSRAATSAGERQEETRHPLGDAGRMATAARRGGVGAADRVGTKEPVAPASASP